MYSDTWPCKNVYWSTLLGNQIEGRLGLFHYIQRITRTLRKTHVDYCRCIKSLLQAVYFCNHHDYEAVLTALKNGSLSSTGIKYTDDDISVMQSSKLFNQRYGKYLRKEIRPPTTMVSMLEDWFVRHKCSSSSEDSRPAQGRLDPVTKQTLFTPETKDAWRNCKEKAEYLQDPLPLGDMYLVIPPNPNSSHGLNEYLSRRGESSLESFHLLLAHFANCGMNNSLADNLNLTGTARFNLGIRHKLKLATKSSLDERSKMPAAWEEIVPYYNHSELAWVNRLACEAGEARHCPFKRVEPLVEDTGERFFSECMQWMATVAPSYGENDMCLCITCSSPSCSAPASDTPNSSFATTVTDTMNDTVTDTMNDPSPMSHEVRATETSTVRGHYPPTQTNHHTFRNQSNGPYSAPAIYPNQHFLLPTPFVGHSPFGNPWMASYQLTQHNNQQNFCCWKYRTWMNSRGRRGRPPHEWNCYRRTSNNNYMIIR